MCGEWSHELVYRCMPVGKSSYTYQHQCSAYAEQGEFYIDKIIKCYIIVQK